MNDYSTKKSNKRGLKSCKVWAGPHVFRAGNCLTDRRPVFGCLQLISKTLPRKMCAWPLDFVVVETLLTGASIARASAYSLITYQWRSCRKAALWMHLQRIVESLLREGSQNCSHCLAMRTMASMLTGIVLTAVRTRQGPPGMGWFPLTTQSCPYQRFFNSERCGPTTC